MRAMTTRSGCPHLAGQESAAREPTAREPLARERRVRERAADAEGGGEAATERLRETGPGRSPLGVARTLPPGPRGTALLRTILRRRSDPIGMLAELKSEYGDIVHLRLGDTSQFLVSDLDAVKHVLVDNHRNYTKGPGYTRLQALLGRGLITSEGERWRSHRRRVQPILQRERLPAFMPVVAAAADEEARRLRTLAETETVEDVYEAMMGLALRIVTRTLLGEDVRGREAEVHEALTAVFDHVERVSTSRLRFLELAPGGSRLRGISRGAARLPTPSRRRFDRAVAVLDEIIYGVIRRRRKGIGRGSGRDLVGMLLGARGPEGRGSAGGGMLSDEDVRDEVMTMFVAGHETSATALTWCLYLLARHPAWQHRIAREARAGAEATPAARLVLDEALRMYPPVWRMSRFASGPDIVGGYRVPAGSVVIVSPWLIQRDAAHWPDPERFDPVRFDSGRREPAAVGAAHGRHRLAMLPFGAGPRMCPGGGFAALEAQVILAALCRAVVFEVPPGYVPAIEPRVTLRPRGGIPLRVVPRLSVPGAV
jgi:cytochrome P450